MGRPDAPDTQPGGPAPASFDQASHENFSGAGATPAMAQWFAAKANHPNALVFFRMGDFYELFFNDAERAAAALDIQLTQRGTHDGRPIAMCGVPVHAADAYLARLIRKGFRVAIVEQIEMSKTRLTNNKTPMKRAVVRVVTPGTLTDERLLEPGQANLLLALALDTAGRLGAAWLDISTGRFETEAIEQADLPSLLERLDPAEILCPMELAVGAWEDRRTPSNIFPNDAAARRAVATAVAAGGPDPLMSNAETLAAGLALAYVELTQAGLVPVLSPPRSVSLTGRLQMDAATRAGLEITRGRNGDSTCLLSCIKRTLTAPGERLLAERLSSPTTDLLRIVARQDTWEWLLANTDVLAALRATLKQAPDMARAVSRIAVGRFSPRDLAAIRDGQHASRTATMALGQSTNAPDDVHRIRKQLDLESDLYDLFARALAMSLPLRLEDHGIIVAGFDGELDGLRALRDHSRSAMSSLQMESAQRYGVGSLKIRHHQQLGYVMEVPTAVAERLRLLPELTLRQSTASVARFSSLPLAELDQRITESAGQAADREAAIVTFLAQQALDQSSKLRDAADALAELDVAQSCATLAGTGRWCRPQITKSTDFYIEAGRHPVVESALGGTAQFIANNCDLSPARRICLLTGPNMAGKSTFLRQNALITILAQAAIPVPASTVRLGIVDRLFCRVGASDDLARGRSTFMVEMIEAAAILHHAGERSLVIIDEIGRGTSTLDGLAIAWAMLEALHNHNRARTIFATHFHELAQLHHELPHLCPHTMRVKEWKGGVVFLHEIAQGAGGRSWGVHVARLANVPKPVTRRAGEILASLELRNAGLTKGLELPLFAETEHPSTDQHSAMVAWDRLSQIEPDGLSPKEALELVYQLKALRTDTAKHISEMTATARTANG